jgi:hypothetical protein
LGVGSDTERVWEPMGGGGTIVPAGMTAVPIVLNKERADVIWSAIFSAGHDLAIA